MMDFDELKPMSPEAVRQLFESPDTRGEDNPIVMRLYVLERVLTMFPNAVEAPVDVLLVADWVATGELKVE